MTWFRWYRGTAEDAKFRQVARYGSVTVRDVLAVWAVILEDAAHPDHRGICQRDEDFIAAVLDLDPEQAQMILEGMQSAGLIDVGMGAITVSRWKDRQFECDRKDPTVAERMRRYRQRKIQPSAGNDTVTPLLRPDTDTDTEERDSSLRSESCSSVAHSPAVINEFADFWLRYPSKVGKKPAGQKFTIARRKHSLEVILNGLDRYIRAKPPDRAWLHPATFLHQERYLDEPEPLPIAIRVNSNGHAKPSVVQAAANVMERMRRLHGPGAHHQRAGPADDGDPPPGYGTDGH